MKNDIATTTLGSDFEESNGEDEYYYFSNTDDIDEPKKTDDLVYYEYIMLMMQDTECLMNNDVKSLCSEIIVVPSLAKMLLRIWQWKTDVIIDRYCMDRRKLLSPNYA